MPKAQALKTSKTEAGEIAGIRITHPDRVVFPGQGVTKRDLAGYYTKISKLILPHLAERPLSLVRCPQGREKECFFQKHASPGWPEELHKIRIGEKSGSGEYMYVEDISGVVAAVQMGVLELHIWGSRVDRVEKPDRMVFDLDPDEGLPFSRVKEAALDLRKRLKQFKLESFAMASGGKGIHVVVPLAPEHSWDEHRAFSEALARVMEEEDPSRYVASMSKKKRRGRIFVDYLRNQRGSTAICPYSTRARKGAHIAAPLSWQGVAKLKNAQPYNVADAAKLARAGDPWKGYGSLRQPLPKL
jgi:bifunctional non-homologous end joining protein LigD